MLPFTAAYTFMGNKITMEYTAHTEIELNCRILYAYGDGGCAVTFNGITPEERSVEGDPAYFTPHGGIKSVREYEAITNTVTVHLDLQ